MSRRGSDEIELNFDGLTDSLTNLVGTLILIVFLMLAITHETLSPPLPPSPATKLWQKAGQSRSAAELVRAVTQLQTELQTLDIEIAKQEAALPQLQQRVLKLKERSEIMPATPADKQALSPTSHADLIVLGEKQ